MRLVFFFLETSLAKKPRPEVPRGFRFRFYKSVMHRVLLCMVVFAAGVNCTEDPYARAVRLVSKMTLDEKFGYIQGSGGHSAQGGAYTGVIPGVPRLGIPELRMNDGPQGFRGKAGTSTQWPSGLTVAHSFDRDLFEEWGAAMGSEFAGKGANCQFGPGVNLARVPNGGRSFEYLSGEDPYLGYTLVQPAVRGIQSQGVIANAKHFIQNNQEGLKGAGNRHVTSEIVDERSQMEMYFPPFEGAVQAGVLSIMCANNLVNGVYVCENNHTSNWLLREHAGFKGWMCSDYDGTRSTIDAANHGLDIAMPGPPHRPDYFGAPLHAAIKAGTVTAAAITEKAVRVVYSLAAVGALDTSNTNTSDNDVTSPEHRALARKLAAASATLLKNSMQDRRRMLPLDLNSLKRGLPGSVVLIGAAAKGSAIYGGGGSGAVTPKAPVSIFDALMARLGQSPTPDTFNCSVTDRDTDYYGGKKKSKKAKLKAGATVIDCCAACNGLQGGDWQYFTFIGKANTCWCHPAIVNKTTKAGYRSGYCGPSSAPAGPLVYSSGDDLAAATRAARAAEIAIVVLAQSSKENADRTSLALDQSGVADAISAVQPNTIVITISPGAFLTPWRSKVRAILDLGMPGEQEGNACTDVLFGDVNPGGKLPHTLPGSANDTRMGTRQYPGEMPAAGETACSDKPTAPTKDGHNPQVLTHSRTQYNAQPPGINTLQDTIQCTALRY
jgi:beta-glucosidase-like glycosyl hydrolase